MHGSDNTLNIAPSLLTTDFNASGSTRVSPAASNQSSARNGRAAPESKSLDHPRARAHKGRTQHEDRRFKEREELAKKLAAAKLAEEQAAKQRQLLIEEESCMRTSSEIYQLWCNLDELFSFKKNLLCSTRTQYQKPQKPLLQYFRRAVRRVLERNRLWILQFHVQHSLAITLAPKVKIEKAYKTRQDLMRNAQDNQTFWENIALACRQTALLSPGELSQEAMVVSKEPMSPRDFSTLRQYATKSWPEEARRAGGMRSCPGTKDGIRRVGQYENYFDMLIAEQDRTSAAHRNSCNQQLSEPLEFQQTLGAKAFEFEPYGQPSRISRKAACHLTGPPLQSPHLNVLPLESRRSSYRSSRSNGFPLHANDVSCKSSRHNSFGSNIFNPQMSGRLHLGNHSTYESAGSMIHEDPFEAPPPYANCDESPTVTTAKYEDPFHLDNDSQLQLPRLPADNAIPSSRTSVVEHVVRLPENIGVSSTPRSLANRPFKLAEAKKLQSRSRSKEQVVKERKSLFRERLPELANLECAPMRRRGQAKIWSEFSNDRILNEIGSDAAWEPPEENEMRPEVKYFRGCDARNIMPSKQTCLIDRESEVYDFRNAGLLDEHLRALAQSFDERTSHVQVLDLSGNHLLTDYSLQSTLECFATQSSHLRILKLGGTQLGAGTLKVLAQAMTSKFSLDELSLQSVPLPDKSWAPLCNALVRAGLHTLDVSDTHCGRWQQQACNQFAFVLTRSTSLTNVDISNNYFRKAGLDALADAISHPQFRLEVLALNDNAWSDCEATFVGGNSTPMAGFCERIRMNKSLQRLDLSRSQVDVMAAYCLEDAILGHPSLQELDVQGNAFGEQGLRAILRTLLSSSSPLTKIDVAEFRDMNVHPSVLFNYGDLTEDYIGSQALFLDSPYHRAILRLILRRTEDFQQPPLACLHGLKVDGMKCNTCPFKKEAAGCWTVPNSGRVEFSLLLDVPFDIGAAQDASQIKGSAQEFLLTWQRKRRVPVSISKFLYLQRTWLSMSTDIERRLFIEALAKEVVLKLGHLKIIADEVKVRMPNLLSIVVSHLANALPALHRGCINSALLPNHSYYKQSKNLTTRARELEIDECYVIPMELRPRKEVMMWLRKLFNFNPSNPNGHYELNLEEPVDFTVMERTLLVDSWAIKVSEQLDLPDLSQAGGRTGIRNFNINGSPVTFSREWQLPGDGYSGEGLICFDYVTPLRVRADEEEIHEEVFDQFRAAFRLAVRDPVRSAVLCSISHKLVLSAAQLSEILQSVKNCDFRRDLYCILFCRCVDYGPHLLDVYTGVLGDKPGHELFTSEQRRDICKRLGHINTLDWHHISDAPYHCFTLDLAFEDDRKVAQYLVGLSLLELEQTMIDTTWTGNHQTVNESVDGYIPEEWKDSPPNFGIFSFTYAVEKQHCCRMHARFQIGRELGWQRGEPQPEIPEAKSFSRGSVRSGGSVASLPRRPYISEKSR